MNHKRLHQNHVAFVEVTLKDTREAALQAFGKAVRTIPEIEECHMIAGAFDYLLKVRTADIDAYRRVLGERISTLPHVASSSTHVAMEAVKETANGQTLSAFPRTYTHHTRKSECMSIFSFMIHQLIRKVHTTFRVDGLMIHQPIRKVHTTFRVDGL